MERDYLRDPARPEAPPAGRSHPGRALVVWGMRLSPLPLAALAVLLVGCEPAPTGPQGDAEAVALVRQAQAAHGSDALDGATLHFTFRGDAFTALRDGGRFRYSRTAR